MPSRSFRALRFLLIAVLLTSVVMGAAAYEDAEVSPEPAPEAADVDAGAAAAEETPAEPVVLNCSSTELIEPIESWSIDCVAQWLENMGFGELKPAFMGNSIDGMQLRDMSPSKLLDEYGVSDEESRKKLIYALKDVVRKDNYKGNTNNWAQFFMWVLPFLAIYKWLTMRYERQIARMTKKYQKWQEARKPPEPPTPVESVDGINEWIAGANADVLGEREKKPKGREGNKGKKEAKTKKVQ
mmetsp:Transcript_8376/g.14080  ORF Transcript_8376/g.14080 Transcript_8376/m.14080 type:complete len:241 (-) Transcript_8376:376-1098(-)|eukprot:CAMPEP_0119322972 /NCGR_PEP_ID=MMETSP1333-20130426/59633_1 /TAXON_ID=418940 /ORGANISM="Scyphosphaera apsteinii, Strain RCC1455" /LENGTH=240 /DNA_ID=CAMNT_0007330317 /DNA_START=29 /DNA_END=751 /DNA_ORIENTATION=+